ncbi:type VI secretion system contractile sheath large subunit [Corallococcus praedator]|uniref:Type VI secretion system contractile sheath large subunit n=1 Tax=Corallococcus praedator TaxID=2316724 RepID=A0ABX9QF77_9BACT|nr:MULTISPECIES: type VI secretion system contractile sheath large subunit [Corallococcus]RKH11391.1 type VI secretion system contractile sheath large subunit [Corallococcus sp. CA047B]RKH28617.1 type VI secretion system contractile sheath large subunit [Corallococcus sp. CA031C]RKI06263.1 type VI secretion system contractile sheath large subunit [Corallococcus praedator]
MAETTYLKRLFTSVRLDPPQSSEPMILSNFGAVVDEQQVTLESRFLSSVAALLQNVAPVEGPDNTARFDKGQVLDVISRIDRMIDAQMNEIIHNETFQKMESSWRGLEDLVNHTNFKANIAIDVLDVAKEELAEDFENNSSNIFAGALFDKVYIQEYDQYGGRPFGAIVGLYDFSSTPADLTWLQRMAKVSNAAHAPFISAVSHKFFGCETIEEMEAIKNLEGVLAHPRFGRWNAFRETEEAAYVGLTFPRYVLRLPWHPDKNPCDVLNFTETARGESEKYLWGNSAILLARNMVKAFEISGWCQSIRGPKGGGLISGLPVDTFTLRGQDEIKAPVEIAIPDYREYEFARSGFIPLVYRKGSSDATFFSTQSAKVAKTFKDPKDSENSQLVTNLAYTFSITRLAHYVKCIMRDNIGNTADADYIQRQLDSWLSNYVTTVANPDDLTVRRFPFKASSVVVYPRPGEIGWYDCKLAVLPHIQFEGLNVELMLESRLG